MQVLFDVKLWLLKARKLRHASSERNFALKQNSHFEITKKAMAKKKFYAVAIGRTPGVYESWPECERQVNECIDRHLLVSQFVPNHSFVLYNTRQKVFVAHASRAFLLKY